MKEAEIFCVVWETRSKFGFCYSWQFLIWNEILFLGLVWTKTTCLYFFVFLWRSLTGRKVLYKITVRGELKFEQFTREWDMESLVIIFLFIHSFIQFFPLLKMQKATRATLTKQAMDFKSGVSYIIFRPSTISVARPGHPKSSIGDTRSTKFSSIHKNAWRVSDRQWKNEAKDPEKAWTG